MTGKRKLMANGPASDIRLVVGLGNPGAAYGHHRHNVGFWCVNRLARLWGATFKAGRLASLAEVKDQPLVLAKPRTFVNDSGRAVAALLARYRLQPWQMLAVCDSLDLPIGQIRIGPKGSDGGHNGLKSIIAAIDSHEFPRLRIGIGRPLVDGQPTTDPEVIADYVLSQPPPDERRALDAAVTQAAAAVACAVQRGLEAAMSQYNA
ncbi:MAG: aminoacyl-tRNA hydrolase [Dehalococcoidia bacterium]